MGDQPTRDGAGDRGDPGRTRRRRGTGAGADPLTVEQVLARQESAGGGRRATRRGPDDAAPGAGPRREAAAATGDRTGRSRRPERQASRSGAPGAGNTGGEAARAGLPPVPGASAASSAPVAPPRSGLPPVPAAQPGLPPVPPVQQGPVATAQPGLPPVPGRELFGGAPTGWSPDERPVRRSGPVPPLPGLPVPPAPGATSRRRASARPPRSPGRRRLVRAATALAVVVGVVVLYHLALYVYVDQRIARVDALAPDGPEVLAPELQEAAETYLVVGTGVPGESGPGSVATLVVAVSPDGERVVLVSVPPTALVDTPVCRTPDGDLRNPVTEAFAGSLLDGGPACMVRAVQQLSGLRIDHYLGVDLADLPGMVDALGGVPLCVVPSEAIAAAAAPPPAGPSELSGVDAAGFLQPGDTATDVTGAAAAERAQRLLTSTLRAAMSAETLLDPVTLTRFLARASDALTLDEQTTLGDLRVLAGTLGGLSGDAVQRTGLPVAQAGYVPTGTDQAYVLLDGTATRALFDEVIDGVRLPAELLEAPAATVAQPGTEPTAEPDPLVAAPADITVDVLNGTGTTGLAATVGDALRAVGFGVGTVGNEPGTVTGTVVRYGAGTLEQARTVAAAVPGAVLQPDDSLGGTVQLVIGPGYTTVVPVDVGAPADGSEAMGTATAAPEAATATVRCG